MKRYQQFQVANGSIPFSFIEIDMNKYLSFPTFYRNRLCYFFRGNHTHTHTQREEKQKQNTQPLCEITHSSARTETIGTMR